ncbi:beta-N-acetylglucosaminidase domain-containing protein [Streptantibioticus rubrisoli]|uniref:Beta-N-acetylglucosaminidase domain-containing protein n=1 Tax=Streptantibioticus rubrisoli TaxID=1387313 RepID=A0ABT1PJ74_9ACTN|nr:beta-N-acetylglucosaminidase domain-containing protein [Streptantibioticus rubrisoli]MCQ4045411.1 beta-N-acetylglucosaminidase domain-containing protein [Streptantibioticus rubrisoli]
MLPRRQKPAVAAFVAAVIGSVLGGAPCAVATPATGLTPLTTPDGETTASQPPAVWPKPQSLRAQGQFAPVTPTVALVADGGADPYALDSLRDTLRTAGARDIRDTAPGAPLPAQALVVYADGQGADSALSALGAPDRGDLPSGGYRLAVGRDGGRDTVALSGVGPDGLFHAAQTLRQLAQSSGAQRGFAGVVVRDWPSTALRGITEGFYGQPWTTGQRLAQLDFMGRTKQDFYLYAPGDDPYRTTRWSAPYPAAARDDWRRLAASAQRNHVTLGWAVAPGQSLCFSSADDLKALIRKVDGMWALGVRAFQLQFTDVSYTEWHCPADAAAFGNGPAAAARAQAKVANALAQHLSSRYGGAAPPLSVLPTEYYQDGATVYRGALANALAPGIEVAWTGVGVLPAKITGGQFADAQATFRHPLLTMDNYPVNDYAQDRIFLGPYAGRDPAVAATSAGLLANAMRQPSAGRLPLFTAADYAWNPNGYQPQQSWQAAVDDLAGQDPGARAALTALAGNDASSALDANGESAYLRPLIDAFWSAYAGTDDSALGIAADRLRAAFDTMAQAPQRLGGLAGGAFGGEVRPWLRQLGLYGQAGAASVDMLLAQRHGDGARGWQRQLVVQRAQNVIARSTATVGDGVLGPFLNKALGAASAWTGVGADRPQAMTSLGSAHSTDPSLMTDGNDATYWWSDRPPQPGDTFGVDLGSARPVSRVRIAMGSGDDSPAADDTLRDAVLEYSADGGTWRTAGTYQNQQTITAVFPKGTTARYLRLRAASAQPNAVAVRSFDVTTIGALQPRVDGPASADGTPPAAVASGDPAVPYQAADRGGGALSVAFGASRALDGLTVLTAPGSGAGGSVEARVDGRGWQRVGQLSDGWTELAARGIHADAVRISWPSGATPPAVYAVVPWFGDAPAARLNVDQPAADADIGGQVTVAARLSALRPGDVRGTVEVRAPKGVSVRAPGQLVLRRGETQTVPLAVSVAGDAKAGAYPIAVSFTADGRTVTQTVTVRAYPRTGGPDLVRGARASSSGDETAAFPASAVADGRADTRWSSPAKDGQWVQVELSRPARVGRVVLHWQDAYASAYRVLVSPDGRSWRTAATVTTGRGGTETVRMDEADTRFIRVQCDQRATPYGISLWELEAYAVQGAS